MKILRYKLVDRLVDKEPRRSRPRPLATMPPRSSSSGPPPAALGAFEAKTRLAELLDHVERSGASITITRRGVPIARLVPFAGGGVRAPERLLGSFRAFRDAHVLPPGVSTKDLVDEGRR